MPVSKKISIRLAPIIEHAEKPQQDKTILFEVLGKTEALLIACPVYRSCQKGRERFSCRLSLGRSHSRQLDLRERERIGMGVEN